MRKRTILIYNQYYLPVNNPPAKRLSTLAEYLANVGWRVIVITGMPNYPNGIFFDGYRRLFKKEMINNVVVYRTWEAPLRSAGFTRRMLNYLSFSITSLLTTPLIMKANIIFISSPPIISAIPYFYISKLMGKKIIFDVRDLWPESIPEIVNFKKGLIYKIILAISNNMYKNSWKVVCITNKMAEIIKYRGLKNVNVITNCAQPKKPNIKCTINHTVNNINVVFTGIITKIQNLEYFILINSNENIRRKFTWHIVGDGEELNNLKILASTNSYNNIIFYGYKDKEFCAKMIEDSDLCLAPLKETEITKMTISYKFIEYSSYGKPIISNWSEEIKTLFAKYKFGIFADSLSNQKLITSLISINKRDLGFFAEESKRMFETEFNSRVVLPKFLKILES